MPAGYYAGRSHPYRDNKIPRLSKAHEIGQFVRVNCSICRITRHYQPSDIQQLCGDLNVFQLRGQFRCDRCNDRDSVSIAFVSLLATEMPGLVVRHLERIEMRRVPIWRDVTL
ncbi:hypothetical protein [Rhizobium sp. SAFR-030]|uniref:hypothetical protein n=1 Tax=Rhizobium sp. SAFR-030 TaxID=3387277 RepID=UPI003F7F0E18